MEAYKRRRAILALLKDTGEVEIEDLAVRFRVSGNSIRNDLNVLAAEGLLRRVRGGAVLLEGSGLPRASLALRTRSPAATPEEHGRENAGIARWAAGLVRDGDAIILDDSSSVLHLAGFLRDRANLTVVTTGLDVALLLAQNPTNHVILAANTVTPDGLALVGNLNPDLLNGFLASRAFISGLAFSADGGLSEADGARAQIKAQVIRLAREVVLLVDHGKLGAVSTFRSAGLGGIGRLVTDAGISTDELAALRRAGSFPVTVVGPDEAATFYPVTPVRHGRPYRIGFGNVTERMAFARQVRQSLELAAHGLDDVELLVRDNNLDRQTTLANADWFAANGVDLVVEYQIDAEAGNVIMDKFQRAGIPVIAVDIPLPGATFFGADNYRAGRMAGEGLGYWIRAHWGTPPDLVLKLESRRVGAIAAARLQGQFEGLASVAGPILEDRLCAVDSPVIMEDVPALVSKLLLEIPASARVAVIAINDDAALGALEAFERAGRLGQVAAVGQNVDILGRAALRRPGFPFIGSTSYGPERYGERILDLAHRLLRGEPVPPAVYVPHTFITKETIDQYYPEANEATRF